MSADQQNPKSEPIPQQGSWCQDAPHYCYRREGAYALTYLCGSVSNCQHCGISKQTIDVVEGTWAPLETKIDAGTSRAGFGPIWAGQIDAATDAASDQDTLPRSIRLHIQRVMSDQVGAEAHLKGARERLAVATTLRASAIEAVHERRAQVQAAEEAVAKCKAILAHLGITVAQT